MIREQVLRRILDGIRAHVDDVLRDWEAVRQEEPWIHMPADLRTDTLPPLIRRIADVALRGPERRGIARDMLLTAASHGEARHDQGFPESVLFRELYLLREGVWRYIREHHGDDHGAAFEAIVRIDTTISLATKACIRGYFRSAYERQGRWPEAIEELAGEWDT